MRLRGSLGLLALTAALTACASSTTPADGDVDGSLPDGNVTQDRVVPPADRQVPPTDGSNPQPDVVSMDDVVVMDDVIEPPMDGGGADDVVVPPMDSMVVDTGVPPTDSGVVTDTGVPPTDSGMMGPTCPAIGLNDDCPLMGSMGACAPLTAGTRTFVFQGSGLMSGIGASCEGMTTSAGPDGVIPLVITENSNVSIALSQLGSGTLTASLFSGTGCGVPAQQRGCINTSGGMNTLTASNLAPGTYWVQFSAAGSMGGPLPAANVTTTITPAPPRVAGDTCPGVMVPSNGTPTTINSSMFVRNMAGSGTEVPTAMCPNITSNMDAVFSFTITETRNVNITVQGPSPQIQAMNLDVQSSCGSSMAFRGDVTCQTAGGATISRMVPRLAPGTYWGVVQMRTGAAASPLLVTVSTTAPTMLGRADMCPGVPLSANTPETVDTASLTQDQAFACFPASAADGNFSFNAPMGQDVLIEAFAGTNRTAIDLQSTCGTAGMTCTAPSGTGRSWQRYSGLMAGRSYTAHIGTNASSGNLEVTYRPVGPLTTTASMNTNDACSSAITISPTGGVYTGNTSTMNADCAAPAFGGTSCNGCNTGAGRDAVYRLVLTARTRVLAKLTGTTASYDPVLYVRSGATCNPGTNPMNQGILFCADDYYGQDSGFDRTLDAGTYWFFVDDCVPFMGGGGARGGAYTLEVITL